MHFQRFEELSRQIEQAKTVAELCEIDETISGIQGATLEQIVNVIDGTGITNAQGLLRKRAKEIIDTDEWVQKTVYIFLRNDFLDFDKIFKPYEKESEFFRFSLALACATQNAQRTAEYFKNFGIKSQENIKEVALVCATQNTRRTAYHFKNFDLKSQEDIKEIALACASQNARGTAEYFKNFDLKSQEDIKEVALACASQNAGGTTEYFKNFGIEDPRDIKEIALACAAQSGEGTAYHFKNFGLEDKQDIREIALTCATQNAIGTAKYFDNFGLEKDLPESIEVFIRCLENNINAFYQTSHFFNTFKEFRQRDIKQNLAGYTQFILPGYLNGILESQITNEAIQNLFLTHAIRKRLIEKEEHASQSILDKGKHLDSALGLFCDATEFSENVFGMKGISETALKQLYFYGLDLRRVVNTPPFKHIHFNADLFQNREIKAVRDFISTLYKFCSISENPQAALQSYVQQGKTLNSQNIQAETEFLQHAFLKTFQELMQTTHKLEWEDIVRLEEQWGDLEVFYTLAARLKNNKAEMELLGKMATSVLDGTFYELKYQGEVGNEDDKEQAKTQTHMLSPEQFTEWKKNPSRLELRQNGAGMRSIEDKIKQAKEDLTQLLEGNNAHLRALPQVWDFFEHGLNEEGTRLETMFFEQKTHEWIGAFNQLNKENPHQGTALAFRILAQANSQEHIQRSLNLCLRRDVQKTTDIENDLATAKSRFQETEKGVAESIVFSTITDNPKLLLQIGALTTAGSCQDYRTGMYVQTLLGYVVDANVKAMLSFTIDEKSHPEDFAALKEELIKNPNPLYFFNHPKKTLTVTLPDGGILKFPFELAQRRRIIKLGTRNEKAAIGTEQVYQGNSPAEKNMEEIENTLLSKFTENCGALRGGIIEIKTASRNPDGVYSDAGGGVCTSRYNFTGE